MNLLNEDTKLVINGLIQYFMYLLYLIITMLLFIIPVLLVFNWNYIKQFLTPQCWEIEKVAEDVYSINKCNGEVKRITNISEKE